MEFDGTLSTPRDNRELQGFRQTSMHFLGATLNSMESHGLPGIPGLTEHTHRIPEAQIFDGSIPPLTSTGS